MREGGREEDGKERGQDPIGYNDPVAETPTDRVVMTRKVRLDQLDRSFDLEFWQRVGAEGRFEAAWQAIVDLVALGLLDENQLRLRRSVTRLERRWG